MDVVEGEDEELLGEQATDLRVPLVGRGEAIFKRRLALVESGYLFPSFDRSGYTEQKEHQCFRLMHSLTRKRDQNTAAAPFQ